MSDPAAGLERVRGAVARRHAAVTAVGALAVLVATWGLASFAAWAGAFRVVRWGPALWWLGAVAGVVLAGRSVARARRRSVREAARLVESERGLRRGSLAGLADAVSGTPAGTSPALVGAQARRLAAALPEAEPSAWVPRTWEVSGRALRRRAALLAAAVGLSAAGAIGAGDAAAALATPWDAVRAGLGARVTIAVSAEHVPRGGAVVVSVGAPALSGAVLHLREPGQSWRAVGLRTDADGRAAHRLGDVRATLHLFATAGGAVSDTLTVRVLEPAFVTDVEVRASYPAYLEREEEILPADAGPLALPVGTVLTLSGAASRPIATAALAAGGARLPLDVRGASFAGRMVVRGSALWRLELVDRAGQRVPEPLPALDVRAVPDSAPVVSIPVPGTDTTVALDLRQGIVVDARDDHGLDRVELVSWRVSRTGLSGEPVTDTLRGAAGADRVVLSAVLDLNGRGLLPGDTLRLVARALDRAPVPHVGTSRELALRLRSMAELRAAVREEVDSLARDAESLAADQAALARRTEDVAAQRQRPGERPRGADAGGEPRGAQEAPGAGQLPFEQAQEAGRIREEQEALVRRADSLRRDLADLARAAQDAGLNDPSWQQQLRELDELLRRAVTPELAQRLEELQRALERLDPEAVRQALSRLAEAQRALREELERGRELFERAATEGALQTAAAGADALRRAEEQWSARAPERRDSAAAAREQLGLRRDLDTLRRDLRDLSERLRARGDTAAARLVEGEDERSREAGRAMDEAAREMAEGRRAEAAQDAQRAAEGLGRTARELRDAQERISSAWRLEVMRLLEASANESVELASEQRRLAREVRDGATGPAEARGRQAALQQGVDQVVRQLAQAAGRNALVSPRLGASLARARREMEEARQALEGQRPSVESAAERGGEAARSLSAAALEMIRSRDAVAGAQSGSGFAEALRQMADLAGQQGALGDQAGGLLPLLGGGEAVVLQLRALAARQRAIADQLERLGSSGLPGHPERLAEEARALADRLEVGRLDRETVERQQRLFRRMLDAGRTLRSEEEPSDPERRSETAREGRMAVPAGRIPREPGLRYPPPGWGALRSLSPAERAMVLDYFRRLNAVER